MARLFISQDRLDAWSAEERVRLVDDVMTLVGDGRSFRLRPAVRFMKLSGGQGDADPNSVVGKVKTIDALTKDGGEHYHDSVIYRESAYDVQQGFVGEPVGAGGE